MKCPNCETQNPEGASFCFHCGSTLSLECSNCGTDLPAEAKFCFNCGQATSAAAKSQSSPDHIAAPAPSIAATPVADQSGDLLKRYIPQGLLAKLEAAQKSGLMEGERRIVTILFCDLKGSTSAAAGLDPEEWSEIMNGAFERMIEPIYRYEGTVARLMGDGLLAFFGAPITHEDDPQRAILAGLDVVQAMKSYDLDIKSRWGLALNVRVGINTGLVVVGAVGSDLRMEYTAMGDAINLAARMEQTAEPGTVQIAEATYKLIAPLFEFENLGGLEVRGKDVLQQAYRVLAPLEEPGSLRGIAGLQAPLIGRQDQVERLQAAVEELTQGAGQIVSLMGEAGLGKSRLVTELRRNTVGDPAFKGYWLEGRSFSYETKTPFAPFIDLFKDFFELETGNSDDEQILQISERIDELMSGQGQAAAPFFATMLGLELDADAAERVKYLPPPDLRGQIFGHILGLVEQIVSQRPLVMVLDDLHWADPTSLDLLQALLPLVNDAQLMIIAAFRPRQSELAWSFHETAGRDYHYRYRAITLSPLDQNQSRELVASLLEVEDLPLSVRQTILDKSEGNPFFVEEIIRSLIDRGLVVRKEGHWRTTEEILDIAIPDTLIGVITARLDKLDESIRQMAQSAAILGREFAVKTLADIAETPGSLDSTLIELQRREIIREKGRLPERTFIFKHALTQQAAYDSMLLSNRRALHSRAAEALLVRQPDQVAEIARHWLAARQPVQALPFLVTAGDQAARAYATAEAIDYYNQALALQSATSDLDAVRRAYEGLGDVLLFANRLEEARENFQAMLTLGEKMSDVTMQISAYNKLAATVGLKMGQFSLAEQYLALADNLAEESTETSGAAEAALIRCQMCTAQADFESVIKHMNQLVEIGQGVGSKEYIASGLEHVASSLLYLTRFEEAQDKADKALAAAREVGNREIEAIILTFTIPMLAIRNGDLTGAHAALAEGLRIAEKIGVLFAFIIGSWMEGEIAQWEGDYDRALSYGNQAVKLALPLENIMPFLLVPALGSLGSAYLHISDQFTEEIAKFHRHALRLLDSPGGSMTGATAWADLGHCAIQVGDFPLAEEVFEKGLNVPTMFMYLEKPRLLAGQALLALARGELAKASQHAESALALARQKNMQHILPLTYSTMGKVLTAQGKVEEALAAFEQAESAALKLGMRPAIWESQLAAAKLLEQEERSEEAQVKLTSARTTIAEIAGLLEDKTLREAYLSNTMAKIAA